MARVAMLSTCHRPSSGAINFHLTDFYIIMTYNLSPWPLTLLLNIQAIKKESTIDRSSAVPFVSDPKHLAMLCDSLPATISHVHT